MRLTSRVGHRLGRLDARQISTVTPGSTAPVPSFTVTSIRPVKTCADDGTAEAVEAQGHEGHLHQSSRH